MSTRGQSKVCVLPCSAPEIIATVFRDDRRLLLFGSPGVGKSTLAFQLGAALGAAGRPCWCLSADPGSPGLGVPGAVTLGQWHGEHWRVEAQAALCTLDAGRFRLPLVSAVRRLTPLATDGVVLLDAPGVVRGVAGKELLSGLVEAAAMDCVLVLTPSDRSPPLMPELQASGLEIVVVHASPQARRPGKRARARDRSARWDRHLGRAVEQRIDIGNFNLIGTPPPASEAHAWVGRQIGLLVGNRTLAMGEVLRLDGGVLTGLLPPNLGGADTLLVRDAARGTDGLIESATPFAAEPLAYIPPADVVPVPEQSGGPRVVGRVGRVDVSLVNGVFGDPQLHLRLRHQGRSLLFDLGDAGRLPARLAHQITDVFISHAHMDHISGFQWLLRSRLCDLPPCRVFGPPGLVANIEGFMRCFLWDRIGDRGPVFEVSERHGEHLRRYRVRAGASGVEFLGESPVEDGILLREPGFLVRSVVLDHHTPVLAYALEQEQEINVRKDRLVKHGLAAGPWLGELKQALLRGDRDVLVTLPDGKRVSAGELGNELVLIAPGKKLVYATDLADTFDNRQRLISLAHHAHTFFCEAPFLAADAKQASATGHLTTRACGEIATTAGVSRLVPFHFSRRYADDPQPLYEEISAVCTCLITPKDATLFAVGREVSLPSEENSK